MLWFNCVSRQNPVISRKISIHPMLRFNFICLCQKYAGNYISIHPMLRFNAKEEKPVFLLIEFQYILCYGSTAVDRALIVKSTKFQYILCYGSTFFLVVRVGTRLSFQYILCYGSTDNHHVKNYVNPNFNTSYVTVQLMGFKELSIGG